MADAIPATKVEVPKVEAPKKSAKETKPQIQFFGEGADKVKFDVDPKAVLIRVYGNGIVLTDY